MSPPSGGRFDPAAASRHWDLTHRPVDLDPPPRQPGVLSLRDVPGLAFRTPASARPSPPAPRTVGQVRRQRRNLVIAIAARAGMSQRVLADVFDLPHSRIHAIIAEIRAKYGDDRAG